MTTGSSPFEPPLPSLRGASSLCSRPLPPPHPPPTPPVTATLDWPRREELEARPHPQLPQYHFSRSGSQRPQHQHLISAGHSATMGTQAPRRSARSGGEGAGGARSRQSSGRGGPGRAPPRARKSRPRALGKCGRGACALKPAPSPRRSGRTSERAGRRLRRERLGSAAGECARAAPRTAALPVRPGARGLCGAGASETSAQIRAPRTPAAGSTWTLGRGGTGCSPRAWGRGRCKRVPLFLQLKAWGSDCSKWGGGAGRTQVSASPVPPSAWWGGAEAGHPYCPRPHPAGSGSQSSPPVGGEALRPRPELIGGSWRQPRSRTRRRTSCRLT